jgi:hypothetical protein
MAEIRPRSARFQLLGVGIETARLDHLGDRVVGAEVRVSTAVMELAGAVRDTRELLLERRDLRHRVERCEQDIAELRKRVP